MYEINKLHTVLNNLTRPIVRFVKIMITNGKLLKFFFKSTFDNLTPFPVDNP